MKCGSKIYRPYKGVKRVATSLTCSAQFSFPEVDRQRARELSSSLCQNLELVFSVYPFLFIVTNFSC